MKNVRARVKAAVNEMIPEFNGMQMLKQCWVIQQQRVGRLVEFEQSRGITVMGHKDIQLLVKIAGSVINH
jgi:hypothetical protein